MLTVFCVRRAGEAPPPSGLHGPGGGQIELLEEGPLGIWFAVGFAYSTGLESVRSHDAVVRTALRSATPVPARYGTVFASEAEVRASLRERETELVASLNRVAGRVEMGIRVRWDGEEAEAPPEGVARSGREYLLLRRRELEGRSALRARADALLDAVEARVLPEGVESVRKLVPEHGVAGLLAHLVHRREVRAYRLRVESTQRELPLAVLQMSGPWAPYSFV